MRISRRQFIRYTGATMAAAMPSARSFSASLGGSRPQTWHQDILSSINALDNKPKKLEFLVPNGCQSNLKPLSKILTQQAGIELHLNVTGVDDINTQLSLAVDTEGQPYDLALPATFGIPDLASNNAIQALDGFAQSHQPKSFLEDSLYTLGDYFDGRLYGYQTDGDAYLMFFNRDWIENTDNQKRYEDRYGEALSLPRTWETLDRHMAFFHDPEKNRYGGSLFRTQDYLAWEWWIRFHAKGHYPLRDDLDPQIDNDAGVAALEELIRAGRYLSPGSKTNGLFENWREYGQGNCYCNIGWGGTQKYLNSQASKLRGRMIYSAMPGGIIKGAEVSIPYFNWGWNYTIPSNASYPEAAYLCALLATTPEVSTLSVRENGFFDPFRESHYSDPVIQSTYSGAFLSAHRQSMKESIPDFYLIGQSNYMAALKTYLYRAEKGEISPKSALKAAANSWRGLHYRYGPDRQLDVWKKIKQRYPEKLKRLLS